MSAFTQEEIDYLTSQRLGRLATVGRDGQPHVVPVAFRYNPDLDTIDISGHGFARRKKWDGVQIQRYAVDYVFPSPGFSLETAPNGTLRGRLEFLFGAYDSNDQTMFGDRTPAERAFTLKSADEAQRGGYHMRQVLEVPSGAAWFRLAVRDVIGDRLGSIEVPLPLMPEKATSTLP